MNEELKKVLFILMDSHRKLSSAEYKRDIGYNNQHFAYKAEQSFLEYIDKNEPNFFDEYLEWKEALDKGGLNENTKIS